MITRGSGNSRNRCPHQPPSSYPPESPTPPDYEELKSWDRRLSENRVRCVVGVRTCDNNKLAGETSTQKSRNPTNRCPLSPPMFIPLRTPKWQNQGFFIYWGCRVSENHIWFCVGVYTHLVSNLACDVTIVGCVQITGFPTGSVLWTNGMPFLHFWRCPPSAPRIVPPECESSKIVWTRVRGDR